MNIALFTDTFLPNINGVVNAIVHQVDEMSKQGNKFLIFTAGNEDKNYKYNENVEVVQLKGFTLPTYKDYKIVIPFISRALKYLKNFNPDIVHVETPFGIGYIGIRLGKKLNIPIVGTHHTFYSDYVKHLLFFDLNLFRKINDWFTAWFFNKCDIVTSPSQALLHELKRIGVKRDVIRIPNGIVISKFKKKKDLRKDYNIKKSVMYFGRVSYEKSIDIVVKAMAIVQKKYPDAIFIVVGDGPNLEDIKKLSKELDVKSLFTGFKVGQELIDNIYVADIFVTASKSENQPMSILEAMACGRALIGVDAKGVPELIVDKQNGLIVKPDDIDELAEKIKYLLEDNKTRMKFQKKSLELIKEYSTKKIAEKWLKLYKELCNKNDVKLS
jgi:1,2-diacylglycerol 3-alpha-glucosyltransferase